MSGITPLLDTLLHQVLGKRADTQPPRDLNQPVRPTSPADAPRALHSDSRLDARTNTTSTLGTNRASPQATEESIASARQPAVSATSTQTHLSSSGRTIADLLLRFPSPPSVLSTRLPLVASGQSADVSHVASRLESSIRDSGLFYESHLSRWYKGELPRQQLEREPQMWRALRFSPAPLPETSSSQERRPPLLPGLQRSHPANSSSTLPAPPSPADKTVATAGPATLQAPASQAAASQHAVRGESNDAIMARSPQAGAQEAIHESLQGIVRHQLEMLVTPALRWEGDVWSGLFMALLIQPPTGHQASRDGAEDDAPEGDSQRTWRSDIDLDLEGIGRIKASVWMQASRLEIDMHITHNDTLERLQAGLPALKARLNAHGFEEVSATLAPLAKETPDAQP